MRKNVSFRRWKEIDLDDFCRDVHDSLSHCDPSWTIERLVECYNENLRGLLDRHAPLHQRVITLWPHAPWYTGDLHAAKQGRRRAEGRWRRTRLSVYRQGYRDRSGHVSRLLHQAKQHYYSQKVAESAGYPRALFGLTKDLLGGRGSDSSQVVTTARDLVEGFKDFSIKKIDTIRDRLLGTGRGHSDQLQWEFTGDHLEEFSFVSVNVVKDLISKAPKKSCSLDPIPTWLVKESIYVH